MAILERPLLMELSRFFKWGVELLAKAAKTIVTHETIS